MRRKRKVPHCRLSLSEALERGIPGQWLAIRLSSKGPGRGLRCRGRVHHMAYECPGLHGEGSRQDIRMVAFARLLAGKTAAVWPSPCSRGPTAGGTSSP